MDAGCSCLVQTSGVHTPSNFEEIGFEPKEPLGIQAIKPDTTNISGAWHEHTQTCGWPPTVRVGCVHVYNAYLHVHACLYAFTYTHVRGLRVKCCVPA